MAVEATRVAPHIYLTTFTGDFGYEDIADMRHQLHALLTEHDDFDNDYVLIYHPESVSPSITLDIPRVRRMMSTSPNIETKHVVFIGMSPAFKLIINTLHRIFNGGRDLHHVNNLDAAYAKARQLLPQTLAQPDTSA